jgi:hypothetical protein
MAASSSANSADCITQGTCKPLGGYSVWAALPPLPAAAAGGGGGGGDDGRPIILVVAQMDSIDMFHDSVQVRRQRLEPEAGRWLSDLEAVYQAAAGTHAGHRMSWQYFVSLASCVCPKYIECLH